MTKVSVIIPTWNREKTLAVAVESILKQTYPVHEVIVCDDGSTDRSKEIVASFNDTRIRWLDGMRGGRPAIPRNRGIKASTGEWLAFLDSDDEWLPSKIEKQLAAASESGCKAVCSNAWRYTSANNNTGNYLSFSGDKIGFNQLIETNFVICSSALIHRSLFDCVTGFPEGEEFKAIEDYALWLKISTQTDFAYIKEPLLKYFDIPGHSIRAKDVDEWTQRKYILRDFLDWSRQGSAVLKREYMALAKQHYTKTLLKNYGRTIKNFIRKSLNGNCL